MGEPRRITSEVDAATPFPPPGGTALPVRSVSFDVPSYGSTAEAAALVGVKPAAKVGPTVQVPLDWLYSSE
jgi:hypothetical protein